MSELDRLVDHARERFNDAMLRETEKQRQTLTGLLKRAARVKPPKVALKSSLIERGAHFGTEVCRMPLWNSCSF